MLGVLQGDRAGGMNLALTAVLRTDGEVMNHALTAVLRADGEVMNHFSTFAG
jgi:hypothetical protein